MAAPSGTVWGSIAGSYGRIGIYVKLTSTATQTTRHTEVWFWSKYSVSDTNNTLYYDDNATSATTSKGSVSINTTIASGSGWSTSNQVKLKSYDYTFTRGTSSSKRYVAAKLINIDRVGAAMSVSTNYTIPALTSYTVKYNANGGSGAPSNQTKYYGKTLTLSSTKPTRTGYTFKGWATSSNGSVAYAAGASYTANASITLYAVWQANTYTVKYNANGGTGAPSNQTKTYGVTLKLSSTKPTRASVNNDGVLTTYTFKGWSTSSTATSVSYTAGANYTANASITLYAVWSKTTTVTTFDVTYNTTGGSKVSPQVKTKGTALTLTSTIPTKYGYRFVGWGLSEDDTTVSYKAGSTYSTDADIVLYAIWTPWVHEVKFNINGGSGNIPSNFIKTSGIDEMIPEIIPVNSGYIFGSWVTKLDGSGKSYSVGEAYDNEQDGGIVTLYAEWIPTDILIYTTNGICVAREFVEDDDFIGFKNDGSIHCSEFIESDEIKLNGNNFYFTEITEIYNHVYLIDELDNFLADELGNYLLYRV